jgi:hypothetical protein
MDRSKRYATGFLLAGLLLALGTPVYLSHIAPGLSVYLMHPAILVGQASPYVVCAAIWLPWRSPMAAAPRLILAALLLVAAFIIYVPMLWASGQRGGDMIGLFYSIVSLVTTAGVLLGSATAGLILWLRLRARRVSL